MDLMPIFVDEQTLEGLYAIRYDGEEEDEYTRLFDLWSDTEYVLDYLLANQQYLKSDYFKGMFLDEIVTEILDEAEELEVIIKKYVKDGFSNSGDNLQMLFRPLGNTTLITPPPHQKTKARIRDRKLFPKDILRVYAIRINKNTFVITGGAIKLVDKMNLHPDTARELKKLEDVKEFLKKNGLNSCEDLIFYYE